jgi:hypothetical protein
VIQAEGVGMFSSEQGSSWGAINGRSPATIYRLSSTAHAEYIRIQRDRLPTHVEYITQQLDSGSQRFCQPGNDDVVSRLPNGQRTGRR